MPISAVPTRSTRRWLLAAGLTVVLSVLTGVRAAAEDAPSRHGTAERLGLRLLNCTRTGGWVQPDGSCKGRGSGTYSKRLPALRLHEGISDHVAFPWSDEMVRAQACAHSIDGLPDLAGRFSTAGFPYPFLGENIGCARGGMSVRDMVIRTHISMQAEKRERGGHWRNMKNPGFKSVGIGVASLAGYSAITYDFYGR